MSTVQNLNRGERKSLAYHQVIADRLSADPTLRNIALTRLQWYQKRNPHSASYYRRWSELLSGPIGELIEVLVGTSQECCALRQENPFVDLISQRERAAIYRRVVDEIDSVEKHWQAITPMVLNSKPSPMLLLIGSNVRSPSRMI